MNGIGGNNESEMKSMDANRYATKKTIAQGMLDIALLTANASQLKYILQVGDRHEFYKLMLVLIITSIVLQVFTGFLLLIQGMQQKQKKLTEILNHIILGLVFFTSFVDVIKIGFGFEPAVAVEK